MRWGGGACLHKSVYLVIAKKCMCAMENKSGGGGGGNAICISARCVGKEMGVGGGERYLLTKGTC